MKAALLIIDAQALITVPELYRFDEFVSNTVKLIETARESGTEVVYIRHEDTGGNGLVKGMPGFEIYEAFAPREGERIFDKRVNSAFRDTGLTAYLRERQTDTLIIAGLQTDYCIDASVKCGFEHHFGIIVPGYANTTFDNPYMTAEQTYRFYNGWMWPRRYAQCMPVGEVCGLMKKEAL